MPEGDDPRLRWIPGRLRAGSHCVHIWGNSRVGVNQAAWEIASRLGPGFRWIEIASQDDPVEPDDPAHSGRIPSGQRYRTVPPSEFSRNPAVANPTLWTVVRSDEPSEVLQTLLDFMTLPVVLQNAVTLSPPREGGNVCVIANCDRITEHFPDDPAVTGHLLDLWRRERVSLISTWTNAQRKSRFDYDYTFELKTPEHGDWKRSVITCEKAPKSDRVRVGVTSPAFLAPAEG